MTATKTASDMTGVQCILGTRTVGIHHHEHIVMDYAIALSCTRRQARVGDVLNHYQLTAASRVASDSSAL